MNWTWLWKILIPIAGEIITRYLVPLLNKQTRPLLEQVLPVAERWVAAVETTGMSGIEKQLAATREILTELKTDGITDISKGLVHTAIQLALVKLGYIK